MSTFSGGNGVDAGALAAAAGTEWGAEHAALAAAGLAGLHAGGFLVHEALLVLCEILLGVVERIHCEVASVDLGGGRRRVMVAEVVPEILAIGRGHYALNIYL